MAGDDAFLSAYGYVEVELPNGDAVRVKPLPLGVTVRLLRLVKSISTKDNPTVDDDLLRLCDDLLAAIEPAESRAKIEQLLPLEMMDLAALFFYAARSGARQAPKIRTQEQPKTLPSSPMPAPPASSPPTPSPATAQVGMTS